MLSFTKAENIQPKGDMAKKVAVDSVKEDGAPTSKGGVVYMKVGQKVQLPPGCVARLCPISVLKFNLSGKHKRSAVAQS